MNFWYFSHSYSHPFMSWFTGQCLVCPSGQFCGSEGLIEPSGQCAAGFLCFTGAKMPNPTDNITGSLCPPGGFCQGGLKEGKCIIMRVEISLKKWNLNTT